MSQISFKLVPFCHNPKQRCIFRIARPFKDLPIGFRKHSPIIADTPKNGAVNHSTVTSELVSLLREKPKFHPITLNTCLTSQLQSAPLERGSLLVS